MSAHAFRGAGYNRCRHATDTTISANIDAGQPWRRSFDDNIVYTDWRRDNYLHAIATVLQRAGMTSGRLGVEDGEVVAGNELAEDVFIITGERRQVIARARRLWAERHRDFVPGGQARQPRRRLEDLSPLDGDLGQRQHCFGHPGAAGIFTTGGSWPTGEPLTSPW